MKPNLNFSPIQPPDLDQIMVIEQQIYPNPWSVKVMEDCLKANFQCIKAQLPSHPDEVACYALMMIGFEETNLLNISVNPKYQRQGIASQMLDRLILISRINHAKNIWLEVRESNQGAINLYEKFKFEVTGLRKNYYKYTNQQGKKVKEHAFLMSRPIKL